MNYQIIIANSDQPKWRCTAFAEEGQVFLPCSTFGDECEEIRCLISEGVPVIKHEGHVYAPTDWLIGKYSDVEEEIYRIVDVIREKIRLISVAKGVIKSFSDQ